jgi:hypothetical protein
MLALVLGMKARRRTPTRFGAVSLSDACARAAVAEQTNTTRAAAKQKYFAPRFTLSICALRPELK